MDTSLNQPFIQDGSPTMTQMPSSSFGSSNRGVEVGQNYGTISAEFHLAPDRPETPPTPSATIPFSRDPDFVNRGDLLDQIDKRCLEPAARVALVGLGGVGKSQLAIEYAYRTATGQADRWVFWVHAGTQARVEEGFRTIADAVKLPGRNQPKANIPQLVYGWLSNERNGRWTIIVDSADDSDVFYVARGDRERKPLASYLPQSRNGSFVVTTRDRDLASKLTGSHKNIIEVGPMSQANALTLLEKKWEIIPEKDIAADLIRALDYVPLAISQAAAYMQARAPRSSVEMYLAEFRKSERLRSRLLGYDAGDLRRDGGASNAILSTWQISFDHIRSKRPSAADLLSFMSFFDRQGIPEYLLKPTSLDVSQGSYIDEADDSEPDSSDDETDSVFEDDVAMLRGFCLITVSEAGDEFEMHGLVQLSTRRWLEAFGRQEKFKQQFITRLSGSFPKGDYNNWPICQRLFPHVEKATHYRPASNTVEEVWATLLYYGGRYALLQGSYEIAEQMASKARRSRERRFGKEDLHTLWSISLLASILRHRGLWKEAEKLEVQVMETSKTKLGADHPDTLTSMANLASTLWNQGRWSEAEKLFVQVMETRKTKLGADHPSTLTSMANLASTYRNQGRWSEAEKLEVQVMETRKTKLGADHPSTLTSMANLASTLWNQGRWSEAEKLFVQVMETRKTKLGADHPSTLTSMANLAFTWKSQGRNEDALALMQDYVKALQRVLGPRHPDTLSSLDIVSEWSS